MLLRISILITAISSLLISPIYAMPTVSELTLDEKIGQLLMVHFNGEQANEDARVLVQDAHVGSFIYYNWANGLHSPEQVRSLSQGLQKLTNDLSRSIPLLISADQEGGIVSRLTKGFTIFPGNRALAMTQEPSLAEESAFVMGNELKAVGVNLNLAPVVDINCNPKNPVIGIRSFGDDPRIVNIFSERALKGYQRSGVISCLKHFPGHGDIEIDSHEDLPILRKSMEQLEQMELMPYLHLASKADAVMTAHIIVPAFDSIKCSTLSKPTLDYLRNILGFKGVIISDSLAMEGVLKQCESVDEAAIQAILAGCDILCLGGKQLTENETIFELSVRDILRIHANIRNAVQKGRISSDRINEAVENVLALKERFKLDQDNNSHCSDKKNLNHNLFSQINSEQHQLLSKTIATKALNVIKQSSIDLKNKRIVVIAPKIIQDNINATSIHSIFQTSLMSQSPTLIFVKDLNPSDSDIKRAVEISNSADAVIFCSYNAWKNHSQTFLFNELIKSGKKVIVIVLRDPQDANLFSEANGIMTTFSPTSPSIQAALDYLAN